MRKNICFFFNLPPLPENGGVERVSCILAEELCKLNYNLFYIYLHSLNTERDNLPGNFKKIIRIDPYSENSLKSTELFLRDNKIEVVLFQGGPLKYLQFLSLIKEELKIKIIVTFHMSPVLSPSSITFHLKRNVTGLKSLLKYLTSKLFPWFYITFYFNKLQKKYHTQVIRYCDKYVFLSSSHVNAITENYKVQKSEKFQVIPNPIIFDQPFSANKLIEKKKIILMVTRLEEYSKRISIALKIWKSIEPLGYDDWRLDIIGTGEDEQFYKKIVWKDKIQNITFCGHQNPLLHYENASIYMMTSAHEGFPMTLLESQQMGVVPITFNSFSSLHDIIIDDFNGVIVKDNHLKLYKERLLKLMHDQFYRNNLAKNAIESCIAYSKEKIVAQWIELFLNLTNNEA